MLYTYLQISLSLDLIYHKLGVYHAATSKLIYLRCLFLIDLPKFEVLKSFLFAYITNFDDTPS